MAVIRYFFPLETLNLHDIHVPMIFMFFGILSWSNDVFIHSKLFFFHNVTFQNKSEY